MAVANMKDISVKNIAKVYAIDRIPLRRLLNKREVYHIVCCIKPKILVTFIILSYSALLFLMHTCLTDFFAKLPDPPLPSSRPGSKDNSFIYGRIWQGSISS